MQNDGEEVDGGAVDVPDKIVVVVVVVVAAVTLASTPTVFVEMNVALGVGRLRHLQACERSGAAKLRHRSTELAAAGSASRLDGGDVIVAVGVHS